MATKEFNSKWDFLIRNSIKKYVLQYPSLNSIYEDLYQECYVAILKRTEKDPDFVPTLLFVQDIIRRYIMAQKMFSSPRVKRINTTEIGKKIDDMSNTTIEFDEVVKVEDLKSRHMFEDVETMIDWERFNSLQSPTDMKILNLRLQGRTLDQIASVLLLSPRTVDTHMARLKNSYKEWLKAS